MCQNVPMGHRHNTGLAKKFIQVFPYDIIEKPEWTF